jgi:hypothetical protein
MSARKRAGSALGAVAGAAAAHIAAYESWRGWSLNWGAMRSEADAVLPGDDLLARPDVVTTRVIGIEAPASLVWPWLAQMGPGRAGAYTYDWIENLFGLNMHSASTILPEFQHVAVGDAWRLGSRGPVLRVALVEPQHALVVRSDDGNWVWALVLEPGCDLTRLISRNRIAMPGATRLRQAFTRYVMEPGSLVMERKMLLGIRARAEHLAAASAPGSPA